MKVSLVVAVGNHKGKVIPISVPKFLIGREPDCQLRPAAAAISKHHCAVFIKDGKVVLKDLESTNGTFVNDQQITGEVEVKAGDNITVGPLHFTLAIDGVVPVDKPTPVPTSAKSVGVAQQPAKVPQKPAVVAAKPGVAVPKPAATASKPAAVAATKAKPAVPKPAAAVAKKKVKEAETVDSSTEEGAEHDEEAIAAMLFDIGGDDPPAAPPGEIPAGTTEIELPSLQNHPALTGNKPEAKKDNKPQQDNSSIAAQLLSKYGRKTR